MLKRITVIAFLAPLLIFGSAVSGVASAGEAMIEKGKEVAFDRKKRNCLACHMIADGSLPGNQGPPLVAMQARFPDKAVLREQIANPLEKNPDSMMPPFGLHNILSGDDIDAIVEYLYTL